MPTPDTAMQGKICLITGANSGIGQATALGLARKGATVVMVSRDRARGEKALNEIRSQSGNDALTLLTADLSSQASIRQLVEDFTRHYSQLHVLINNAGLTLLRRVETVDGLETTFAVNYLAPFLLTNLLLDTIKASAPARIINVSSNSQASGTLDMNNLQSEQSYRPMKAYAQSKVALIAFTYDLARRLQGTGVTVNCLHPGFVATNIGQSEISSALRPAVHFILARIGLSPEEGAKTSLYLATSPEAENLTGKYFIKGVPRRSIPITYDEGLQQQLWDASARLTHLPLPV